MGNDAAARENSKHQHDHCQRSPARGFLFAAVHPDREFLAGGKPTTERPIRRHDVIPYFEGLASKSLACNSVLREFLEPLQHARATQQVL